MNGEVLEQTRLRTAAELQAALERVYDRFLLGEIEAVDLHHVARALGVAVLLMERADREHEMMLLDRACGTQREFPRLVRAPGAQVAV